MYPRKNAPTERVIVYWVVSLEYRRREYFKEDKEEDMWIDGREELPIWWRVEGRRNKGFL